MKYVIHKTCSEIFKINADTFYFEDGFIVFYSKSGIPVGAIDKAYVTYITYELPCGVIL